MFEHSVKVPRHYKIAANIFKKVSTEGGSVKSLLYDNKLRHFRTDVLFAIITETIKHVAEIEKIFESCKLFEHEPRLDPWLAKILTTELLYGKKELPGKSKPEQTILSYRDKFESYKSQHQDDSKPEAAPRPRYIRVNTNLLTTSDAIRSFQEEGYRFVRCTSGSYDDYLEQVKNLTEYDFTQDYHVKTVFVFPPGTKLHNHELYLENKIILQNKASTLSVHLMAAPPGSVVLDMCAAPGMKTTQLAAYLRNNGKIYAVERNEKRYQTLCDFVQKTASSCVQPIHRDCLEIKRGEYKDVEYILLDPSCSGSGMDISVHNYIEPARLARLTSLQEKFLKHAMNSFPRAKRIVYSTCSMFPEENERVITNVVKTSRAKWRVREVKDLLKGQWNNFGSTMYGSMGTRCLYARPESDLTTGFFLAVLDRDEKDLEKSLLAERYKVDYRYDESRQHANNRSNTDSKNYMENNKHKNSANNNESDIFTNNTDTMDDIEEVPKRKKKMIEENQINNLVETFEENVSIDAEPVKKKKKKRDRISDAENGRNVENLAETLNELAVEDAVFVEPVKKKKKKRLEIPDEEAKNGSNMERLAETVNEVVDDTVVDEPVKKKKKKKDKKDSDLNDNVDAMKKCEEYENIEDTNINELQAPAKKKKRKRNKEIQETETDELDVTTDMVTDEPKKKKKKKHDKIEICLA